MPTFLPDEHKIAVVPVTVTPADLGCKLELFLGPDESTKISKALIDFLSTGSEQKLRLPLSMPIAVGTYYVYLDLYAEENLIGMYKGMESISISGVPLGQVSVSLSWL